MSDILSSAQITAVNITTKNDKLIDITQTFLSVSFYQSMFKNFMTGQIVVADTMDMISNFPLVGNEKITIAVQNNYDNSSKLYEFVIYKIDRDLNTFTPDQKVKILNMYLMSFDEFMNHTKISKRFNGLGSNVVDTLIKTHLKSNKTLDAISTYGQIDFVSNFWSFDDCIKYVCDTSSSEFFDYMFFENNNGYNFKPLSHLFTQQPTNEIKFDLTQNQIIDVDAILKFQFNSYFDDLMWRKRGMFGSTGYQLSDDNYSFDVVQKTIQQTDENIKHTGINRMYCDESDVYNRIFTTYNSPTINTTRKTHINFLSRYNFVANLNGDIDRNIGDMYKINFPNYDNESSAGSDSLSGNWIAMEINTTIFENNDMKQNVLFGKNALFNNFKLDKY